MPPNPVAGNLDADSEAAVLLDELNRILAEKPPGDWDSVQLPLESWRRRFRILREQRRQATQELIRLNAALHRVEQELTQRNAALHRVEQELRVRDDACHRLQNERNIARHDSEIRLTQLHELQRQLDELKSSRCWRFLHYVQNTLSRIQRGIRRRLKMIAFPLVRGGQS